MEQLQRIFHYEGQGVRTTVKDGTVYFVGKDVCDALEIANARDAISRLKDEQKANVGVSDGSQIRHYSCITETGVYKLVFRSNKPEAERFTDWIAEKVIPSIRETGSYSMEQPKTQAELSLMMAQQLVDQERKMNELESGLNEANERIDNFSNIMTLNPRDWRSEVNKIINSIAFKLGGSYQDIRKESYRLLEKRGKCDLERRLQNRKRNMVFEGTPKSKVDKLNKMDVIEDDKRLTEIYLSIVKEMAIKNQVRFNQAM